MILLARNKVGSALKLCLVSGIDLSSHYLGQLSWEKAQLLHKLCTLHHKKLDAV